MTQASLLKTRDGSKECAYVKYKIKKLETKMVLTWCTNTSSLVSFLKKEKENRINRRMMTNNNTKRKKKVTIEYSLTG